MSTDSFVFSILPVLHCIKCVLVQMFSQLDPTFHLQDKLLVWIFLFFNVNSSPWDLGGSGWSGE